MDNNILNVFKRAILRSGRDSIIEFKNCGFEGYYLKAMKNDEYVTFCNGSKYIFVKPKYTKHILSFLKVNDFKISKYSVLDYN